MPPLSSACPDLILLNGNLQTQDPRQPNATAAAVVNGMLVAIGDDVEVHAVGDRARREILAVLERVADRRPSGGSRSACRLPHRIEHVQMIRPEDIRKMARLGVAVAVQPANLMTDMDLIDDQIGAKGRYTYSFQSLLAAGIPVSMSSDAPVYPPGWCGCVDRRHFPWQKG